MISSDTKNDEQKQKKDIILVNNLLQEKKNKLQKIFENIFEIKSEEKNNKRNNSFNYLNISYNKKLKIKEILISQKKTKDIKRKNTNEKKNSQKDYSKSISSKQKSEKLNDKFLIYNLNKGFSINSESKLYPKSFKTITNRNFVLKSELCKLNQKDISKNKYSINNINKDNENFEIVLTQKKEIQEKSNKNDFNNYLYNNTIASNIYMDNEEENWNRKNQINSNNIMEKNNNSFNSFYRNNNSYNLIGQYFLEGTNSLKDEFLMKNINLNDSNQQNIINKDNELSNNIINYIPEEKNLNKQISEDKSKKKEKDFSLNNVRDKEDKEKILNINLYNQDNSNNCYNINNTQNILGEKTSYYMQNNPQYQMNYTPNYLYPLGQSNTYFNKNLNLYPYYNNAFFLNNLNKYQDLNSINNYNQNNLNIISINNNLINDNNYLANNVMYLIKNQTGNYILQKKLLEDYRFANDVLFPRIKNNLKEIICDFFGNSLIKTLLDILTYENIDLFINLTEESLYDICLTEPGSRVIQKLIEKINDYPLLLNKFVYNLSKKNIGILFKSPYGNYILQKYLSVVKKKEFKNFIYEYIFNNFIILIREKHGVCVLQKSLVEADNDQKKKLFENIVKNLEIIMKDCYGNYLIQFILSKSYNGKIDEILPLIKKIEENIVDYCKCKFSASVIEKCFENSEKEISEHILKYLLDNHFNSIINILVNPYGFYVIKKSMFIKNNYLKEEIMKIIINNKEKLLKTNNGKKIISIFSSDFKEFSELLK